MERLLKLNLGCGNNLLPGYVNVDRFGKPDIVHDLEKFPWPWKDDSVREVVLSHVLEHLGQTTENYFGIIKELYRICAHGARVTILVPHPRHDDFLCDPTHVRPITPNSLELFSRAKNQEWAERGNANSTLALFLDVDFEIVSSTITLDEPWHTRYVRKTITEEEVAKAANQFNNVIKEVLIVLKVVKHKT